MHLTILDSTGGRHEAVLLAASATRMRVVIKGSRDTIELRASYREWFSEDGEFVEFESITSGTDYVFFCRETWPLTYSAGSPRAI